MTGTRVVNIKQGANFDVYIGRPGRGYYDARFGNPIKPGVRCLICGKTHGRQETIPCYGVWLDRICAENAWYRDCVRGLAGKVLGCFCVSGVAGPAPAHLAVCHGQPLALKAEALAEGAGTGVPAASPRALWRVETPSFIAGVLVDSSTGRVVEVAPILRRSVTRAGGTLAGLQRLFPAMAQVPDESCGTGSTPASVLLHSSPPVPTSPRGGGCQEAAAVERSAGLLLALPSGSPGESAGTEGALPAPSVPALVAEPPGGSPPGRLERVPLPGMVLDAGGKPALADRVDGDESASLSLGPAFITPLMDFATAGVIGVEIEEEDEDLGFTPTAEQLEEAGKVLAVLDAGGKLAMLTGSAGVGKSAMLRYLLRELKRRVAGVKIRRVLRRPDGSPRLDEDGEPMTMTAPAWVLLLCPTWRALLRAWQASGHPRAEGRTCHGAVYAGPDPTPEEQLEVIEAEIRARHGLLASLDGVAPPLNEEASAEMALKAGALYAKLAGKDRNKLTFSEPRVWPEDAKPSYVVLDEGSMIPRAMYEHFRVAFGDVPLVVVGDYMQLPPVEGEPAFDLEHADGRLRTVHRQAKGSAILDLLTRVRDERVVLGRRHDIWKEYGFEVYHRSADEVGAWLAHYLRADREVVCVVARHRVRRLINDATRKALGYPHGLHGPQVGERVVFRGHGGVTAGGDQGAYNGEFARVLAVGQPVDSPYVRDYEPGTEALYSVFPVVVGVERGGTPRLAAGVCLRAGFYPEDPKDEGRLPNTLRRLVRGAANRERNSRGWTPDELARSFKEALAASRARGAGEVDAMLSAAVAVASGCPLFALVDGGFGMPIASGAAVTCWTCQGHQAESVVVVLESVSWLADQEVNYWYTAASRATKQLIPVVITDAWGRRR